MSSLPSPSEQPLPPLQRSASVVIGSQSFVNVLLRSTAGELYKIRRRAMSKILLLIGAGLVVIAISVLALGVLFVRSSPICKPASNGNMVCVRPSAAELAQRTAELAAPLHLPNSLPTTVGIIGNVGLILLVILAGAIAGGEYGVGTLRVLLTRGPTRTQYLLAKILAILVCIAVTMVILIPIGIIVGALYNLSTGISVDWSFLTGDWVFHAIAYILLAILNLFSYAIIALCLATLGKSTAAGIAGGLVFWFIQELLTTILTLLGLSNPGTTGDILKAIPDYFVSNNTSALLTEQSNYLTVSIGNTLKSASNATSTIPDWRAWLVIAAYLVVFLGITWWVSLRRDVTN